MRVAIPASGVGYFCPQAVILAASLAYVRLCCKVVMLAQSLVRLAHTLVMEVSVCVFGDINGQSGMRRV